MANDQQEFNEFYKKFEDKGTLSAKEEKRLLILIKAGDKEARIEFIERNMRLVISCVMKFCGPKDPRAMSLISDGTIGLFTAIDKFDISLGFKFSTYAVWWINSKIRKGLNFFSRETVASVSNLKNDFKLAKKALEHDTGRIPTEEEVYEFLGWSISLLRIFKKYNEKRTMIAHNMCDDIPSTDGDPVDISVNAETKEKIANVLHRLKPLEEDIVRRRYGISCDEETLKEISDHYGKSRERIRQIESAALRKLYVLIREGHIPPASLQKEKPGD